MSTSSLSAASKPELDRLEGLVERVTFHNADSGFCVLRLKVRGERELITLIGHTPTVAPGEYASASGTWVTDREHGRQFKAVFVRISPPTTLTGIERYLGSGMVKGIGPVYAGRLVKAFGAAVFDTIEQTPARLREVEGIGEIRAKKITSGWADQKVIREIMVFLHGNGVSTSRAVRIFKTYGQDAVAVVTDNPYRLAQDIRGIGFLSADTIAQKVGIARDSPLRARAGVSYALAEAAGEGNCGLPRSELVSLAVKLLDIEQTVIEEAIDQELAEQIVIADTVDGIPSVFLASLYNAERSIVSQIKRLRIRDTALVFRGHGQGNTVGGAKAGNCTGRQPEAGNPASLIVKGTGHHWRSRRRQDDTGQFDPHDPACETGEGLAVRANRTGGQAAIGIDRPGSKDDPPTA